MKNKIIIFGLLGIIVIILGGIFLLINTPQKAVTVSTVEIPKEEINPEVWGQKYPDNYDSYLKNYEGGIGESKYKGSENFSRLDSWPFQYVLYDGWGMGIDYTESRGHTLALIDQLEIDDSRKAAGGVCLTCKSPYVPELVETMGEDYFSLDYYKVYNEIPEEGNTIGVACIDCHNSEDMSLNLSRWTVREGLEKLGKDPDNLTRQEERSAVCAQCHVTYSIPKNSEGKSIDLIFPWDDSQWENITIENIEKTIEENQLYEWTHKITGMRMGHIRHPEFELFSNNSTHWAAGLSCADCHMPYERVGNTKITTHHWTSPLKQDLKACMQCHNYTKDELKERIFYIQDRVNHLLTKAGFAAAQAAKAIEFANETEGIDEELLNKAKEYYRKAYYRVTFVTAENSMGFHNPEEAMRVLSDGLDYARKSEMTTREALLKAGVTPPKEFDLELERYNYNPELNKEATLD